MLHSVPLLLAAMEFAKGYGVYGPDFQNHKSLEALHLPHCSTWTTQDKQNSEVPNFDALSSLALAF